MTSFLRLLLISGFIACLHGAEVTLDRLADGVMVTGSTYRLRVRGGESPLAEIALRQGDAWQPVVERSAAIIWGDGWKRVFDGGACKTACTVVDGAAPVVRLAADADSAGSVIEYRCSGDAIAVSTVVTVHHAVPGCRRVSLELNPIWAAAAGRELAVRPRDGQPLVRSMPATASKDYVGVYGGRIQGLELGLVGDGRMRLDGDVNAALEQTGTRFRWHLAAPDSVGTALQARQEVRWAFTLAFQAGVAGARPTRQAVCELDAAVRGRVIPAELFGAQLYGFGDPAKPFTDEQLQLMSDSGVSFFRLYLSGIFGYSEPDPVWPSRAAPCDYSRGDRAIAAVRALGIDIVPVCALYCPPWLSSRRPSPDYHGLWIEHRAPPTDNALWAGMIAGLVRHYNREQNFGLKLWQIGNEPNDWKRYWVGGTLPEFATYFTTAATAMKQADPAIRISGPDLSHLYAKAWPDDTTPWRTGFMAACGDLVDDFSFNCYGQTDFAEQIAEARTVASVGGRQRSVWLAEYHVSAGDDTFALTDFRGATFIARALTSLIGSGADRASAYAWGANRPGSNGLGFFTERDGHWLPLPSWHAFRLFAKLAQLKGATLLKAGVLGEGIEGVVARHADGHGVSLILIADDAAAEAVAVRVALAHLPPGITSARIWQQVPEHETRELAAVPWSADRGLQLTVPSRSLTLVTLRP